MKTLSSILGLALGRNNWEFVEYVGVLLNMFLLLSSLSRLCLGRFAWGLCLICCICRVLLCSHHNVSPLPGGGGGPLRFEQLALPRPAASAAVRPVGGRGRGGKPRQTIQSPNRQYKAPTDYTKPRQTTQSIKEIIQRPRILNKTQTY